MEVAVVTKYRKIFNYYVRDNYIPNMHYIFIDSIYKIVGRKFDAVRVIDGYEEIKNFDTLIRFINDRITDNK